ncbi:arginine-tRNA-protein transferase 1 [Plenodomus tracheiphilus IPT5]|uniref:arginyltransferase n=1 Tax=Plenodomus tracheiphilus IPT5 TaxID=1408161 RepID=A0A6A7B983_9PLEO|nr:arginine-tRNA-protein transferase 1 [Plenodomus tracheiphilus IPT5]
MQSRVTPFGASYYFSSKSLTVEVYQILVDRGWRRSGTIFYKPDVLRHCCPHYTIRLPAATFKPSKDQRKAVNHWNDFVLGEAYTKEAAKLYPLSKEEKARLKNAFDLTRELHRTEVQNVKQPPEPAHRFEVTLEPAEVTREKYELFANYQRNVHKEKDHEISMSGFKRFLCESPLQRTSRQVDGKEQLLGSYHQCYRLDGRLIAMSVLDLLPHCVSGVYMLYHSDFEKWQFGKLSALREAALAHEGGYQFYYMGYYIHSCTKMKYKGDYKTQHVLDPETYEWNPLDAELRDLLDKKAYVSLARERRLKETEEDDSSEIPFPTAAEAGAAISNGTSLFDLKVPGLMTIGEIEEQLDLDSMPISIGNRMAEAQDLVSWESADLKNPRSIKGIIGELVACLGPEAAWQVVVELG